MVFYYINVLLLVNLFRSNIEPRYLYPTEPQILFDIREGPPPSEEPHSSRCFPCFQLLNPYISNIEDERPMDDAKIISSEVALTLGLPPSCIQFCPAHPNLFVVGTYNLEKNDDAQTGKEDDNGDDDREQVIATKTPQSRNGSLVVFKVDGSKL